MANTQLSLMEEMVPSVKVKPKNPKPYDYSYKTMVKKVLLLGMGVQSVTLACMAALGEIETDLIIFSDTGYESMQTLDYACRVFEPIMKEHGMEYHVIRRTPYVMRGFTNVSPDYMFRREEWGLRASFPFWTSKQSSPTDENGWVTEYIPKADNVKKGSLARQCTGEFKVKSNTRFLSRYLLKNGWAKRDKIGRVLINKDIYIITQYGITTDERGRAQAKGTDQAPRCNSWQLATYPFLDMDMSRADCIDWLQDHGIEVPVKSACYVCPYRDDSSWAEMKFQEDPMGDGRITPGDFSRAVAFERLMNNRIWRIGTSLEKVRSDVFIHPSCIQLDRVNFDKPDRPHSIFEYELVDTCKTDGGFTCGL